MKFKDFTPEQWETYWNYKTAEAVIETEEAARRQSTIRIGPVTVFQVISDEQFPNEIILKCTKPAQDSFTIKLPAGEALEAICEVLLKHGSRQ